MQPMVVAALVALVLLSAPPAVLAAALVHDLRRARRRLPRRPGLARVALALNREWAATPAQCRVAELRRRLFEGARRARALVAGHDDPHAGWLLGDADRLAWRLDDRLRGLFPVADAAPAELERLGRLVEGARGCLDRIGESVALGAGDGLAERLGELAVDVALDRAARLDAAATLRARGLSSPACDSPERTASAAGHILKTGVHAPGGEPWQGTSSTATITASSARSVASPAGSVRDGPVR